MTNYETYESPFCTRYASEEMQFTFSAQKKFSTFRRLWVALARAEMKLGLEQVTQEKVDELEAHIDDIDFAYAAAVGDGTQIFLYGVRLAEVKTITEDNDGIGFLLLTEAFLIRLFWWKV